MRMHVCRQVTAQVNLIAVLPFADKETIAELLEEGCIGIIPEGIAGMYRGATPQQERVFLKDRKGFVVAAVRAGTALVPVYHLGQSQLLQFKGFEWLSRKYVMFLGLSCTDNASALQVPNAACVKSELGPDITICLHRAL